MNNINRDRRDAAEGSPNSGLELVKNNPFKENFLRSEISIRETEKQTNR